MTIHKRNQRSGGQATRRLYRYNGKMCARCGVNPRYVSTRGIQYRYCQECYYWLKRGQLVNQKTPGLKRRPTARNHVINPKTDEIGGGFRCDKCLNPVKRKELNSHWKRCARGEA